MLFIKIDYDDGGNGLICGILDRRKRKLNIYCTTGLHKRSQDDSLNFTIILFDYSGEFSENLPVLPLGVVT